MIAVPASAQTFTSGSTGADGALDFSNLPAGSVVTFDPKKFNPPLNPAGDNIFNFTTINIPAGITVRLSSRVLSGPVFWLASGDVTLNGTVDLNGENGAPPSPSLSGRVRAMPGAGGFSGGVGGKEDISSPSASSTSPKAQSGDGPTGGLGGIFFGPNQCANSTGFSGGFSGNPFLVPLVGGSGGGGGEFLGTPIAQLPYGAGGGAGGGAILIASSTSIIVNGSIRANGGNGSPGNAPGGCGAVGASGAAGSGGAVRLVAPTVGGTGILSVRGGNPNGAFGVETASGIAASPDGAIRIETFSDAFRGTLAGPFAIGTPFSLFLPTTPPPSITVSAVNGIDLAQPPTGKLTTPDAIIDTLSPVQITIQASFIPPGTVITLHVFSDNNTDQTVQTTPLLGTLQSSTATANVTFPSGFSLNFVKATWTTP
jgi:hypothetical protein